MARCCWRFRNIGTIQAREGELVSAYLDVREIAAELHVSVQTVNRWCREGKLHARRAGRKWLIRREDLDRFLEAEPARTPDQLAA
jgi:excisionase family DNA binding protein